MDDRVTGRLADIAKMLEPPEATVDLIIVDDAYIQRINRDYRGHDRPTDVISFAYGEETTPLEAAEGVAGEIYLSYETLERDARDRGVDAGNLFLRTGVHGLLHVLGYDHKTDTDASKMEGEEKRLLLDYLVADEVEKLF